MNVSFPSEAAIEAEIIVTGLDRMQAIRRIQQRTAIQRQARHLRRMRRGARP